jgi:ATP-dependent Lon protease
MSVEQENTKAREAQAAVGDEIPHRLPVLPLRDVVVFPYMIFPVLVGRESSLRAANEALSQNKYIFLAAQKDATVDEPAGDDLYRDGTVAKIVQVLKLPNGLLKVLVDGVAQASVRHFVPNEKYLEVEVDLNLRQVQSEPELDALVRHVSTLFAEYVHLNPKIPAEALTAFENIKEPYRKLYYVGANISQSVSVKQGILQLKDLPKQLYETTKVLSSEIALLKIEKEIDNKLHDHIQKSQRKFFLQEQIRSLQDELGEEESTRPHLDRGRRLP